MVFQQEDGVSRVLEAAVLKEGDPVQVANGKGHANLYLYYLQDVVVIGIQSLRN